MGTGAGLAVEAGLAVDAGDAPASVPAGRAGCVDRVRVVGAYGPRAGSAVSGPSPARAGSAASSEARIGGVPRWRVLRLRRESGSAWGRVEGADGVGAPGELGADERDAGAAGADGAGAVGAGVGADGAGEAAGVATAGTSPPRMRSRVEPTSSVSASRLGGVAGTVAAGDAALASTGRDAGDRRSMGVRARCGWTPRGGAGWGFLATGRGVGTGLRGSGTAMGGGDGAVSVPGSTSSSSSHGFAGMGMPPAGAGPPPFDAGADPRRGFTARGALIRPVKFAMVPCDSGSWAIPVGRIVTAYAPAASTLVMMSERRGFRGAIVRKSPR